MDESIGEKKKRGRKPKEKPPVQEKTYKKRGRRPKIKTEEETSQQNDKKYSLFKDDNNELSLMLESCIIHAEKELGKNPVIASVNFGAERKFQLKHTETGERIDILLKHGSLLIMKGELQHFWKHQIPKTKKVIGERVNLTFRVIK